MLAQPPVPPGREAQGHSERNTPTSWESGIIALRQMEGKPLPGMPLASSIQDGYALLKRLKLRLIEAVVHTPGIQELLVGTSFYDLPLF